MVLVDRSINKSRFYDKAVCSYLRPNLMEWSKEKTLLLIELLQENAVLWNPTISDSRKDKQRRREQLGIIAKLLGVTIADTSKKIQHLRTQYNRESVKESRSSSLDNPNDMYFSSWYAYEYLHFLKEPSKIYKLIKQERVSDHEHSDPTISESTTPCEGPSFPNKLPRSNDLSKTIAISPLTVVRDEFSVFGEYIANELRSLRGEKNILIAKKKIQDVIFEVKMDLMSMHRPPPPPVAPPTCPLYETQKSECGLISTEPFNTYSNSIHCELNNN